MAVAGRLCGRLDCADGHVGAHGRLGDGGHRRFVVVTGFEAVEFFDGVYDFRDVEKRVAFEADVNKRGLHAGEHFGDPALVDVANHAALTFALDEDLDDLVLLEDRDPRVVIVRGDDHLLVHVQNSTKCRNVARVARTRRPYPESSELASTRGTRG